MKIGYYGKTENQELVPFYNICKDFYNQYGRTISINEYLSNLMSIMEKDFGKKFNNLNEIEMALQGKQDEVEEQQYLEQIANDLTIKQKFIRFLAQSKYIRNIPFINSVIDRQIKMLPASVRKIINNGDNVISFKISQGTEAVLEEQDARNMYKEEREPNEEDKDENMESQHKPRTLLDGAIVETERITRTGKINEQAQDIRRAKLEKVQDSIKTNEENSKKR